MPSFEGRPLLDRRPAELVGLCNEGRSRHHGIPPHLPSLAFKELPTAASPFRNYEEVPSRVGLIPFDPIGLTNGHQGRRP
jgi:hypothetical protein